MKTENVSFAFLRKHKHVYAVAMLLFGIVCALLLTWIGQDCDDEDELLLPSPPALPTPKPPPEVAVFFAFPLLLIA